MGLASPHPDHIDLRQSVHNQRLILTSQSRSIALLWPPWRVLSKDQEPPAHSFLSMGLFKRTKSSDTRASIHSNAQSPLDGSNERRPTTTKSPQPTQPNGASGLPKPPSLPNIALPPAPNPDTDPAAYLRSIYAVRQQTQKVLAKAKKNELKHFKVDMTKLPDVAKYVVSIIKVG